MFECSEIHLYSPPTLAGSEPNSSSSSSENPPTRHLLGKYTVSNQEPITSGGQWMLEVVVPPQFHQQQKDSWLTAIE